MSYNEKNLARIKSFEDKSDFVKIPVSNLEDFSNIVDKYTNEIDKTNEILVLKNILGKIKEAINNLILVYRKKGMDSLDTEESIKLEIGRLKGEKNNLEFEINKIKQDEKDFTEKYNSLQKKIESEKDTHRDMEKRVFQIMAQINEIKIQLNLLNSRENKLFSDENNFKNEFSEALVLIGDEMSSFANYKVVNGDGSGVSIEDIMNEDRVKQEEKKGK